MQEGQSCGKRNKREKKCFLSDCMGVAGCESGEIDVDTVCTRCHDEVRSGVLLLTAKCRVENQRDDFKGHFRGLGIKKNSQQELSDSMQNSKEVFYMNFFSSCTP